MIRPEAERRHASTKASQYAHRLGSLVAVLHKRRASSTETQVTHVVGEVRGRSCLIIDDMISTGGTIARAIDALLAAGARPEITVAATHGLFVGNARAKLSHTAVRAVYTTDSTAVASQDWPKLHSVSIAPLLTEAIHRLRTDGSLGDLY